MIRWIHWRIYCFTIFFLFFQNTGKAQFDEKDFIHYTAQNGLSDNFVNSIQQDEQGYIWIATEVGLNRFDGHRFNNYWAKGTALPLEHDKIRKLKRFNRHELAIISDGGLQILNTQNFTLHKYQLPDSGAIGSFRNRTADAVELPGDTYAITTAAGFYVINKNNSTQFRHDAYQSTDVGKSVMRYGRSIFVLQLEDLLIYHEPFGLSQFNPRTNKFIPVLATDKSHSPFIPPPISEGGGWMTSAQISKTEFIFLYNRRDTIVYYDFARKKRILSKLPFHTQDEFNWNSKIEMMDDSTGIINGGDNGYFIFHLNKQTGLITFNLKKFLPSYKINTIFFDRDKRMWIGSTQGLLCQKTIPDPLVTHNLEPSPADERSYGYTTTYKYKDKLYLGRYSWKLGLVIVNASTMRIEKQLRFFEEGPWNEILSIQMYHPDTLWIGTNAGILWLDTRTNRYGKVIDQETKLPVAINGILAPARPDGFAWMCSLLGGKVGRYHIATRHFDWYTSQTNPALPFDKVKNITYDSYGDVWFGGHALARWNSKNERFDTLISVYAGSGKYYDDILAITADMNGSLWLHNAYNGLLEYKIAEKRFIPYSTNDGLPTNALLSMSNVVNGIIWMSANTLLIRFNTVTKKISTYNHNDGLSLYKPSGRSIYFDSTNKVFYHPCFNEVVSYPEKVDWTANNSSELILQELNINSRRSIFDPKDGLRLNASDNNLFLHFTVIDFESSNDYRFSYRMNDEEPWHALDGQRFIALSGLSAGNYNLQLKATSKSGFEKLKTFNFTIAPPLWKTPWFLWSVGLLLLTIGVLIYRWRIGRIRHQGKMEKQMAELEIKGLHAQMNPHFIFNSLNSIKEMILEDQKSNASRYLSKFAQLIRTNLDQSRQAFITVRQCVDHLQQYLEMEKIRFDNFTYSIDVDENGSTEELLIAPLLVQPLVENAIWHGLHPHTGEKKLSVRFFVSGTNLICEIEDNGIGIIRSTQSKSGLRPSHRSLGVTNVKERLQVLNEKYRMNCSLAITDKTSMPGDNGTGTIVRLELTILNNNA